MLPRHLRGEYIHLAGEGFAAREEAVYVVLGREELCVGSIEPLLSRDARVERQIHDKRRLATSGADTLSARTVSLRTRSSS